MDIVPVELAASSKNKMRVPNPTPKAYDSNNRNPIVCKIRLKEGQEISIFQCAEEAMIRTVLKELNSHVGKLS